MNRLANLPTELQIKIWSIVWVDVIGQLSTVTIAVDEKYRNPYKIWVWCGGKYKDWGMLHPHGTPKNRWKRKPFITGIKKHRGMKKKLKDLLWCDGISRDTSIYQLDKGCGLL